MSNQIYSAKYSGVDVYEFIHSTGSVMKRKDDNWLNATHILKAAKFAKAKRTRILEKEVIKGVHEKVQGGFGKYQGTWVPLDIAKSLAEKFDVYDELKPLFDFNRDNGSESPPPAPKHHHASKGDPTKKRAYKSASTSALLPRSKRVTKSAGSFSETSSDIKPPTVPKRRGRPPTKRKLGTTLQRSQSDTEFRRPALPNVQVPAGQLPSILQSNLSSLRSEEPVQRGQFKELDIDDGLSSDVEQQQIAHNAFEEENENTINDIHFSTENYDGQEIASIARTSLSNRLGNGIPSTASSPSTPTTPSELSEQVPFDHRFESTRGSPSASSMNQFQTRPESLDINDKVNKYLSQLVEYFTSNDMRSNKPVPIELLSPPANSAPYIDAPIDPELHTAFHWACAMGNLPIIEALYNIGTSIRSTNSQGQTPLMRCVIFHNCYTRRAFPRIFHLLQETVFDVDLQSQSVIHHIVKKKSTTPSAVYYLEIVLSKLKDYSPQYRIELLLNAQDSSGNTALHLAAKNNDHVFYDTLLRNGASQSVFNKEKQTPSDILNQQTHYDTKTEQSAFVKNESNAASFDYTNYLAQTNNEVTSAVSKIIDNLRKFTDSYNELYQKRENDIRSLQRSVEHLGKSITNVNAKTMKVLNINSIEEVNSALDHNKQQLEVLKKQLFESKKALVQKLQNKESLEFKKLIEKETSKQENVELSKEKCLKVVVDYVQRKLGTRRKIEQYVEECANDTRLYQYRRMICQAADMTPEEVDASIDTILQALINDKDDEIIGK